MKTLMFKLALATVVVVGAGAVMAQEMGTADQPQTITEQMDPDKGPEIVKEAEEKQPEIKEELKEAAEQKKQENAFSVVKTLLTSAKDKGGLGLKEGWDKNKKAMIVIGTSQTDIEDPAQEEHFMNTRQLKTLEAVIDAKAKIIRAIDTKVKGVDRVACMYESGTDDATKAFAEKKAALEAKKLELAKKLAVLDERESAALAGVTLSDRFGALIDAIVKKLDAEYSKDNVAADKQAAYEAMKAECAEVMAQYKALEKDAKKFPKYPDNEVNNDVVMTAKMPVLGASVLLQSESWIGKKYQVAVAVVWSPKLQANALRFIKGEIAPSAKKGTYDPDEWAEQQYLPCMLGSRRITDKDGNCVFIGIGAEDISGPTSKVKAKKRLAEVDAVQSIVRALYADIDAYTEANRMLKEYEKVNVNKEKLTDIVNGKHKMALKGCLPLTSIECEHPISGRQTYVTVYYVDPDLNKTATSLMQKAYADAGLAEKAIDAAIGEHDGMAAKLDEVRKSKEAYNAGVARGKKGVQDEMNASEAAKKAATPKVFKRSVQDAPVKKATSKQGVFSGDNAVDTDF